MPDTKTLVTLIYAGFSLALGGITASYEIWSKPVLLDRADGRGKFPTPKESPIGIFLFVTLFWFFLVLLTIRDTWRGRR